MKKIKQILKKLKSNAGSSIVMVVVSVAFIGIIVGALLAAAVQSYRLKLEELNSRDNFYYVEQALNEIYAGVGSQTVEDLKTAYVYTVENMVEYDLVKGRYVTKSQDEAQKMFSKEFYHQLQNNPFFKVSLDELSSKLASYISNDSVVLDASRIQVVDYLDDDNNKVGKIIKNLKLSRTQEYNRSSANGVYTQSITTDIVVGDPDFSVLFDSMENDDPNIFKYAMVADMGIEVNQPTVPLTIAGNVYAASDYYNKQYNESTWSDDVDDSKKTLSSGTYNVEQKDGEVVDIAKLYTHGSVTSKSAKGEKTSVDYTYYNKNATQTGKNEVAGRNDYYDGVTMKSRYSGFYVNGSQVSIMADTVIVPGTMAVMDNGSLSIYGKNGSQTAKSEVWTDNIVLDGYSKVTKDTATKKVTYKGADAIMKADLYVKDDTELNASGSTFQLSGDYFGYGDSTEKDDRKFTPVVDAKNFQIEVTSNGKTKTENRGHYNSSAIIVNGEQSTLNLAQTKTLFLAGRTYIELSKDVNTVEDTVRDGDEVVNTVKDTYAYHPTDYNPEMPKELRTEDNKTTTIRDYKMGESISVKSNQQAYIPVTSNGIPTLAKNKNGESLGYYLAELPPTLKGSDLFEKYFPSDQFDGNVPCVLQEVSGKKYYYYDFQTAYDQTSLLYRARVLAGKMTSAQYNAWLDEFPSAQYFAAGFIEDYSAELEKHRKYVNAEDKRGLEDSVIAEYLVDIGDYEDFDAGNIVLPDADLDKTVSIYSSGAITTKKDTTFSIVRGDDTDALTSLLTSDSLKDMDAGNQWVGSVDANGKETKYTDAYQLSNDLEMEYDYVKWNLGHYSKDPALDSTTLSNNEVEKNYIKALVNDEDFGDASITPLNKFLDMSLITKDTNITPNISGSDAGKSVLDLASGYSVWVSNDDIVVKAKKEDKGEVRGVVITKGDVYFDSTSENGVTDFEGVIIAGGKVYVNGNVKTIAASAEICRAVLRECLLTGDDNSKLLLNLFRGYEPAEDDATSSDASTEAKSIDKIDYTDVVSFANWMKNVE